MPQFLFDGRNGQRQAITPDNTVFNGNYCFSTNLFSIKYMVRKFKGLTLESKKVGSYYYLYCTTDTGEKLPFGMAISRGIRQIMKGIEDILSKENWENINKENVTENHFKTYREAFRFLDANT